MFAWFRKKSFYFFLLAILLPSCVFVPRVNAQVGPTAIKSTGAIKYGSTPWTTTWYGVGEDIYLWAQEKGLDYLEEWTSLLDNHIVPKWKFTVIRLPFHFPSLGPNPMHWHEHSDLNYDKLENILALFDARGIKAIADDHSYANFGSQAWIDEWVAFSNRFKNDPRIMAYELRNEASEWSWEQGPWWDGSYCQSKSQNPNWAEHVARAYTACTDAIRAIEPNRTVIWSDPRTYYMHYIPPDAIRENVYYAYHKWCEASTVSQAIADARGEITKMEWWMQNYSPNVWLGEFGSHIEYGDESQKAFMLELINWCVANDVGFAILFYSRTDWGGLDRLHDEVLAESDYAALVG